MRRLVQSLVISTGVFVSTFASAQEATPWNPGMGYHGSISQSDTSISTSFRGRFRMLMDAAQKDAAAVLEGGVSTDTFAEAVAAAEEQLGREFRTESEAALYILEQTE